MDKGAESYRRYLKGDDGGLVEIMKEYGDGLILFLNRFVGNIGTAEELAEEVFVRLAIKRPKYSGKASFKTWIYTFGRNLALNHLKRERKRPFISLDELDFVPSDRVGPEEEYIRDEDKRRLYRAISRLNWVYGTALILKFLYTQSNREIGIILRKNDRQVENIVYQAKQALKRELEREGFDYDQL